MARLAVTTWEIGAPSETFVRRHMEDLHPGATVGVAMVPIRDGAAWTPHAPVHVMRAHAPTLIDRLRHRAGWDRLPAQSALYRFLRQHDVSAIMGEYLDISHGYFHATRRLGIPFYAHAHGYDVSQRLRQPGWVARYRDFADCAGVVTVSEHSRQALIAIGLPAARIHVVPCSVDVPAEPPAPAPALETIRCVAVGRMVAKKAPLITLEAFRIAAQRVASLKLDMIGGGPLLVEATEYVRDHGLTDRVRIHGPQPNAFVRQVLGEAHLFLQHSRVDPETGDTEGLPVGILEAMAYGIPVVSTRHTGIPEAVQEGGTGLLVDEGDVEAMADSIVQLARDADLRKRMGRAAWERARQHFTWELERDRLSRLMGLDK